jgi:hypothetical protein
MPSRPLSTPKGQPKRWDGNASGQQVRRLPGWNIFPILVNMMTTPFKLARRTEAGINMLRALARSPQNWRSGVAGQACLPPKPGYWLYFFIFGTKERMPSAKQFP